MTRPIPRSFDSTAHPGAAFRLRQPWQDQPSDGFQPTDVRLAWTAEALFVEVELADDDIVTRATADQQRMWELGDVFEVFLQVEGRREYVELHVTPNNMRLHLRLPDVAAAVPFDEMLVHPVGFESTAERVGSGWHVTMTVPAAVLEIAGFDAGMCLRVSFCRYDAATTGRPVLSTTAAHPVINFHRPHEWTAVRLVG